MKKHCLARIFYRPSCTADFQVCCITGFLTCKPCATSTPCRFGNRRYSKLGNLRYTGVILVCHANSVRICFFALLWLGLGLHVWADPQITSWFTVDSGQFARIYRTDADRLSGKSEVTWGNGRLNQLQPADCGVQEIYSSANWVYVRSTGLAMSITVRHASRIYGGSGLPLRQILLGERVGERWRPGPSEVTERMS